MHVFENLLDQLVKRGGSDLHISAGAPPKIRVDGDLVDIPGDVLTSQDTKRLVYSILTDEQVATFERDLELDFSFGVDGLGRFRTNVFQQRGAVGAVLRLIPSKIVSFDDLGLPRETCEKICDLPKGLVLVTGATGSGKSTSLASMIDCINRLRPEHIVTIEDPIEFLHKNKKALFNQREVGSDTRDFKKALRSVLRQDPDVVMIGELRDLETVEAALTLAETGHLTFATLHTSDAVQTINRVIDIFPAHQQQQIRTQLSFALEAVFCQQLIPNASGKGRAMACEVMLANSAVRALVRDNKAHQCYSQIQLGGKDGMRTMNQSLWELVEKKKITLEAAMERSSDKDDLMRLGSRRGTSPTAGGMVGSRG